jgi:hypothetical protein
MVYLHATHRSLLVRAAQPESDFTAASAAELVAGGKPVSMMQNISDDLLDGGAELHYATGDAGDRAGTLDDDEQCAGGAARSALALLAPPCGVG